MGDLTQFFGGQSFNPDTVKPDVITPGDYTVVIEVVKIKPTKKQDGHYLEIQLQIIDEGPFKGQKIWDRLNLDNPSEKAVRMAQQSLRALCIAAGLQEMPDTDLLLQKVVTACVKVKDGVENNIRTYKVPGQAQVPPAPAPVGPLVVQGATTQPPALQYAQAPAVAPQVPPVVGPPVITPPATIVPTVPPSQRPQ